MENQENESLEPQDSEPLGSESEDESQDEPRSIDLRVLIREFALDGFVADESWLKREKPTEEGMKDYELWRAKWAFRQCVKLAVHFKLPNDPPNVNFGTRFSARFYSLPENKELWATLCEQEIQAARRERREPDPEEACSQQVLRNRDAKNWLVDEHIARLWVAGEPLPPRAELMTSEGVRRLQGAIRARRFRRAKREENPEAV